MRTLRWLKPLLYLMGSKGREAARQFNEVLPKVERDLKQLRETPDQFNTIFAEHGWIASDVMNHKASIEAIRLAETAGVEAGEQYLEDHYNEGLAQKLMFVLWLKPVQPRRRLIELALQDHQQGRYHASVPVVLAQIDGITYDLAQKSFFERGKKGTKHLRAFETTAGDPTGLPALASLLSGSRSSTTEDPARIPYRHGILHGRDLAYDSRRTSTKCLAALICLRDWILAVEKGEQFVAPEQDWLDPETATWDDVKSEFRKTWESLQELAKMQRERD